jgi:murein DD-endopeptidase MepM/ murein hydrolase activator NlpD
MFRNRQVASSIAAVILGAVLMSFQNCAGGLQASQTFENDIMGIDLKIPENHQSVLKEEMLMAEQSAQQAAKGQALPVCNPADIRFAWPMGGTPFVDWVVVNYVDRAQTSSAIQDYMGKAHTYDNHRGIDINVPSFRDMDLGTPVYASASGQVIEIQDGNFDRNRACGAEQANFVKIKHANGIRSVYVHLRKNSVAVAVGQQVAAGQKIGEVGSSGCSPYPHLHFEVVDCNGNMLDPMALNMFSNAPLYTPNGPSSVMDTLLKQPQMASADAMVDPGVVEPNSVKANQMFSMGFTLSSMKASQPFKLEFIRPDGTPFPTAYTANSATYRAQSHWYWHLQFAMPGEWTAKYSLNGVLKGQRKFSVLP